MSALPPWAVTVLVIAFVALVVTLSVVAVVVGT